MLSRAESGELANDTTVAADVTMGARFVAMQSLATNLVDGDRNQAMDVFVLDRATDRVTRESLDEEGFEGRGASGAPSLSDNGRFLVFQSAAALASGDRNGFLDIYHRDRTSDRLRRVTTAPDGADADGDSSEPSLSLDGRVLAFVSAATNLVDGDENGELDVFVIERRDRVIRRITVGFDGSEADGPSSQPHVSSDGRFVTFTSGASNLVEGDDNGVGDVFVHEIATGVTVRASVRTDGGEADGSSFASRICGDGSRVVFSSRATNLATEAMPPGQIYVRDLVRERTRVVSVSDAGVPGNGTIFGPRMSSEGRYIAFSANSDNLVAGIDPGVNLQIYVHDVLERRTVLASEAQDGGPADGACFQPRFTSDSSFMTFASSASNLVVQQTNSETHAYLWRNRLKSSPAGD